jgi:hypothetical protein
MSNPNEQKAEALKARLAELDGERENVAQQLREARATYPPSPSQSQLSQFQLSVLSRRCFMFDLYHLDDSVVT